MVVVHHNEVNQSAAVESQKQAKAEEAKKMIPADQPAQKEQQKDQPMVDEQAAPNAPSKASEDQTMQVQKDQEQPRGDEAMEGQQKDQEQQVAAEASFENRLKESES